MQPDSLPTINNYQLLNVDFHYLPCNQTEREFFSYRFCTKKSATDHFILNQRRITVRTMLQAKKVIHFLPIYSWHQTQYKLGNRHYIKHLIVMVLLYNVATIMHLILESVQYQE
jgi:hypothetical protein